MLVHLCLSVPLTVILLIVFVCTVTYELINDDDDDDDDDNDDDDDDSTKLDTRLQCKNTTHKTHVQFCAKLSVSAKGREGCHSNAKLKGNYH